MRAKQSISHTAYPDGTIQPYLFGMTPPKLTNMGHIMKKAAFEACQQTKVKSKLKKVAA